MHKDVINVKCWKKNNLYEKPLIQVIIMILEDF